MTEQPSVDKEYAKASPWPIPLVLGLVAAELGIVFGGVLLPVSVVGLLLLGGSVVGILRESGYAQSFWRSALAMGAIYGVGGVLVVTQTSALLRGQAMLGASVVSLFATLALYLYETGRL